MNQHNSNGAPGDVAGGPFSVVVRGGELKTSDARYCGQQDIGIRGDRIVAIGPKLACASTTTVVDARGSIVTPGLIDVHAHCYWGATYFGAHPDAVATRSGVTTWVDAGSSGAWTLNGLRALADRCQVTMRAWLNIAAGGMTAMEGELDKLDHCDVRALTATVEENRDFILGVKVRLGHPTNGRAALDRALQAADAVGLPLMAHIGYSLPGIEEIIAALRPGDILTHVYVAKDHCVVKPTGELVDGVLAAKERGVLFDVAHGRTAFSWRVAEHAIRQGLTPDFLTTDLHLRNIDIPHMELPSLLSKFMYLGFTLDQVIAMVTKTPVALLGLPQDIGHLRPGARADIALFRVVDEKVDLADADGDTRPVERLIRHVQTLIAGLPVQMKTRDRAPPYLRTPAAGQQKAVRSCC
jgi:dihydroorotase